jgi:hypothetical protein
MSDVMELRELANNKNKTELGNELRDIGVPFNRKDNKAVLVEFWVQAKTIPQRKRGRPVEEEEECCPRNVSFQPEVGPAFARVY